MKPQELLDRHNKQLQKDGIPYVALPPYNKGNNPTSMYRCKEGHEFRAARSRVAMNKSHCPTCVPSVGRKLTHKGYELRLLEVEADFYPLEKYAGASTKIKHSCVNGHVHEIEPRRVWEKANGCPYCSGMIKKTTESYKAELLSKNIEYIPVEEYVTIMTKIKHQCYWCAHTWSVKPHDILNGSGCPVCASMGFNRGKPAVLYYVKLWDEHQTFYKIGITNKTVHHRLKNCGKHYKILLERQYETGREAEAAEQMILDTYKYDKALVYKWLRTGGDTELFKSDILLLDKGV